MAVRDAPTSEVGQSGMPTQFGWLWTWEQTPEVAWPQSVEVYDRMRKDGHVASTLRAITLPIRQTRWFVQDATDVRPEVATFVRDELGLTETTTGRRRRRREGVSFDELLANALLELPFGHSYLEQVYELGPPRTPIDGMTQVAHLRKLGPRLPRTISGFDVARDGGLRGIRQWVVDESGIWDEKKIPVDRLVAFVFEREGSDWAGQSILRPAYPHWLIKQQLIRIDAMSAERNGMGLPVVTYDETQLSQREALDIARSVRSGEDAGAAFKDGAGKLELMGVTGDVKDVLASIRYHDQEIGRSMLAMFLDLGHDRGARSLGDTFVDFFVLAEGALLAHLEEVITEHVVRDLVEVNFGPDEAYPEVVAEEVTADSPPTAEALKQLSDGGYIVPDDELEAMLRRRWGFPVPPGMPTGPVSADPGQRGEITPPAPPNGDQPPIPVPSTTDASLDELEARLAAVRARRGARGVASRS